MFVVILCVHKLTQICSRTPICCSLLLSSFAWKRLWRAGENGIGSGQFGFGPIWYTFLDGSDALIRPNWSEANWRDLVPKFGAWVFNSHTKQVVPFFWFISKFCIEIPLILGNSNHSWKILRTIWSFAGLDLRRSVPFGFFLFSFGFSLISSFLGC